MVASPQAVYAFVSNQEASLLSLFHSTVILLCSECIRNQPLFDERIGEENGNKTGVHLIVLVHGLEGQLFCSREDLINPARI